MHDEPNRISGFGRKRGQKDLGTIKKSGSTRSKIKAKNGTIRLKNAERFRSN